MYATLMALPTAAWASENLINGQGATAPCIGIGPIAEPLVEKCAKGFELGGFIRDEQVGVSGLTIGEGGVVSAVAAASPAATAGLQPGDIIARVNGVAVRPSPAEIAASQSFGERGKTVRLTIRRGATDLDISLIRSAKDAVGAPTSNDLLVRMRPLVNWRGQFLPCMGGGLFALAIVAWCEDHFEPYGFINDSDLGSTGFELNPKRADAAIIGMVDADSPAAKAGLQAGDEIIAVGGQPLTADLRQAANAALFGKVGDTERITVRRGGSDQTVMLTLVAKASPH